MTSEQPVVTRLYRVEGDTVTVVDARAEGEHYHYSRAGMHGRVDQKAVDTHCWFSTPEGAIRQRLEKLRESRWVFAEAQADAARRVEQIDASIAKLEAQL